ncbi:MAG: major vault protein [Parcubacteria group bacterium Gr01-1014_20]|nr:MAG: major vault protein [Parcubacteria group bacterium Gr01-1014_20]
MAQDSLGRGRDLVLAPGEFAFVLDTTKGLVNVIVGPNKTSMSDTDQPVQWDPKERRFSRCGSEEAAQAYPNAPEGFYLVLTNPVDAGKDEHPREAASTVMANLKMGRRVNIPGPTHFPLWPGQTAKVIEGHHLRSNQYLVVRVYNDEEARLNWAQAVVKPQTPPTGTAGDKTPAPGTTTDTPPATPNTAVSPPTFTMGQLMVIKGTEVAFFIPPTGVEVIPEKVGSAETYVREAVTLERLEYCILLDEDGNKRYKQGPDVVFPEPTETFVTKDGNRKFRAIELNENSGIYLKVIADYTEEEVTHKVGDELFVTGKDQAIYFPREEHSIIRYGDQTIHYAVAVPSGEGRYLLDRKKGEVRLVTGPIMLLPDPRKEVIIRRVLDLKTVELWYPGNQRSLQVNEELATLSNSLPPGEYLQTDVMRRSIAAVSRSKGPEDSVMGDTFRRGTTFTPPRTVILDTKYEGAVAIDVWTGYAVLVVSKMGTRRVVQGPETILLQYDETLMSMELSTGTPKTDDRLLGTAYLRVKNNKVSDVVRVETQDLVQVDVSLSYRVNFEGDEPEHWFAVENYVRFLVDHLRSLIRNTAKHHGIEEFYAQAIDIIRDAVLGTPDEGGKRAGRAMAENGMRVYDVEVLDVKIGNPEVARLLTTAQIESLQAALRISNDERDLEITRRSEEIKRGKAGAVAETAKSLEEIEQSQIQSKLTTNLARIEAEAQAATKRLANQQADQETLTSLNAADLARKQAVFDQEIAAKKAEIGAEIDRMKGETEEIVKRAQAVDANLAVALTTFSDQALVEKIATALAPMAAMSGVSAADILAQLFGGTPFEGVMKLLGTRTRMSVETTRK